MNKLLALLLLAMTFAHAAFANGEGGHTGNGGGTVECPGKDPILVDYYEAQLKYKHLLDLEKLSREEFFKLMIERLKLGSSPTISGAWFNFVDNFVGPNMAGGMNVLSYHQYLAKAVKEQKKLDQWPEISSWRVKDEFVDGNLPEGCHFEQAAISLMGRPVVYRIKSVTDRLSHGQRLLLELHEFLNQMNEAGSSISVRQLVGALIRKKVNYPIMRVAESQFEDPTREYVWKRAALRIESFEGADESYNYISRGGNMYDQSGLYVLDLRGKSEAQKKELTSCAHWVGILPLSKGNYGMQFFRDGKTATEVDSEELVLPRDKLELLRKTIVGELSDNVYRRGVVNSLTKEVSWDLEMIGAESANRLSIQRADAAICVYQKVNRDLPELVKPINITQVNASMKKDLFSAGVQWYDTRFETTFYTQRVRTYYEEKRLGFVSPFEAQVESVRKIMNW